MARKTDPVRPDPAATLQRLQDILTAALLRICDPGDRNRTLDFRLAAETILDARQYLLRPDGKPDWGGRHGAYRAWLSAAYTRARIPLRTKNSLQASIRHHLNTLLRERLTDSELAGAGLSRHTSPPAPDLRRRHANRLGFLLSDTSPLTDPDWVLAALRATQALLDRVDINDLTPLSSEHTTEIATRLDHIKDTVTEQTRALQRRTQDQTHPAP